MRITVSHNKPKQQIKDNINRSFDDLFRGVGVLPLQIVDEKRAWTGDTLTFSFGAKVGFITSPIKGTVEVTDKDVTVDADLGVMERLFGGARTAIEGKVRGLLT